MMFAEDDDVCCEQVLMMFVEQVLMMFGTDEQKRKWLQPLLAGNPPLASKFYL